MIAPVGLHTVNSERGVERQGQTKKLVKRSELNTGAALEKTAKAERNKKCSDKSANRERGPLRVEQNGEHQLIAANHTPPTALRQAL